MATLVQAFPSTGSTITMLQTRSPSTDGFQGGTSGQQQHQRGSQVPRNMYNSSVGSMAAGSYRGHTPLSSSASYAFNSPSIVPNGANPLRQHPTMPRYDTRTASAPVTPFMNPITAPNTSTTPPNRLSSVSAFNLSSGGSVDDTAVPAASASLAQRPLSAIDLNSPAPIQPANTTKPAPDRYKRNHRRADTAGLPSGTPQSQGGSALPSGSGMATVGHLYSGGYQTTSTPTLTSYPSYRGSASPSRQGNESMSSSQPKVSSVDDMVVSRPGSSEQAKRYRRRSISSLDAKEYQSFNAEPPLSQGSQPKTYAATLASPAPQAQTHHKQPQNLAPKQSPGSAHGRNGSNGSSNSGRSSSRPSSAKREASTPSGLSNAAALQATPATKHEAKLVNIPPRGSSDASKRVTNPSPLSRPMTMNPENLPTKDSFAAAVQQKPSAPHASTLTPSPAAQESPAAQQLAALSKKDGKKEGKSSRLRRAFSFGSAAELRKASAENNMSSERAKLRKDRYQDEQEAQQAAIVQKQEASGLGEGIYSGQGHFFTGSTDNLSISSTASSASIMIRKMGKGVKKGSRSLVGLFRPKSVVGVAPADGPVPEASVAQVSMVTVEAEREKVNVNVDPHDQAGGGTGFPKLERNSLDAATVTTDQTSSIRERSFDAVRPRRSIVGGERERSEVLAAVKKGILKRNGTDSGNSSPVVRPVDARSESSAPQLPHFLDSPASSAPSTPKEDPRGPAHRKTESIAIEGDDYFMSLAKYASGEENGVPGTPRSMVARNISFSPRLQFHDTWTSVEYDRRGEIATCNRLTPMLAQQIKEELNTFKMEMEIHHESKKHTHFF
ncbi:bud neck involved protein [Xanthoria parietina]